MSDEHLPFTDLMLDMDAWTTWVPRASICPNFQSDPNGGPGGRAALIVAGNGNAQVCGCWQMSLPECMAGHRYCVDVRFKSQGVIAPGKCIRAILTTKEERPVFYAHLDDAGFADGWRRLTFAFTAPDPAPVLTLHLFYAWAASGFVAWADARLYRDLAPETPRLVHAAAISGDPPKPESPAQCLDFYAERIDSLSQPLDLICLPEVINIRGLPGDSFTWAEPVPGPTSELLAEKARETGAYIAASILEQQGDAIYNTGLLLDRSGGLVSKYRKTHPTLSESLLQGRAPGNELPVFHTDFGTLGYMICYDGHYPEVPRLLALKGAEILLFSNMSDSREGGVLWEPVIKTRAVDNQVYIVAAVNSGRSCIVSPKGEVLALTDQTPGSVACATCDLNTSLCDFSKRPIYRRYDQLRRADLFADLARHFWDV